MTASPSFAGRSLLASLRLACAGTKWTPDVYDVRSETGEISGKRKFDLGLIELDSNATGPRVRKAVLDSLEPLGISRAQIRAVVGDGGSNLQRGYGPLEYAPRIDGVIIHPSHGIGAYIWVRVR